MCSFLAGRPALAGAAAAERACLDVHVYATSGFSHNSHPPSNYGAFEAYVGGRASEGSESISGRLQEYRNPSLVGVCGGIT